MKIFFFKIVRAIEKNGKKLRKPMYARRDLKKMQVTIFSKKVVK